MTQKNSTKSGGSPRSEVVLGTRTAEPSRILGIGRIGINFIRNVNSVWGATPASGSTAPHCPIKSFLCTFTLLPGSYLIGLQALGNAESGSSGGPRWPFDKESWIATFMQMLNVSRGSAENEYQRLKNGS